MTEARRNLELKARCPDLAAARSAAAGLGARRAALLRQRDTFFKSPRDRLKLREITALGDDERVIGASAELIAYARADDTAVRTSRYHLVDVPDPAALSAALAAACGVRGVVAKRRELWLWHNVRIHLDAVDGLGDFLEFEAVMGPGEDDATASARLETLRAALQVRAADLVAVAYADLLGL